MITKFKKMIVHAVYNEEDELVSIHRTYEGANKNKDSHNKTREGHYVDIAILHE